MTKRRNRWQKTVHPLALGLSRWGPVEIAILGYFGWILLLCGWLGSISPLQAWIVPDACVLLVVLGLRRIPLPAHHERTRNISRHLLGFFVVLPLAYSQAGAFGTRLVPSAEHALIVADRLLFHIDWTLRRPAPPGLWTSTLQVVYLANYLLLLTGLLLALFLPAGDGDGSSSHRSREEMLESICGSLLAGLFLAYAFYPLLPAVTPRLYFAQLRHPAASLMHDVNWWLLARFSIPWGIFPSGHVAGPSALACALAARGRKGWALLFAVSALLIGIATVVCDYHFVSDAIAGALTGAAGWALVETILHLRRRMACATESEHPQPVESVPVE